MGFFIGAEKSVLHGKEDIHYIYKLKHGIIFLRISVHSESELGLKALFKDTPF